MIESKVRKAIEHYEMIAEGDSVAVGVSGGKDSLVLLAALGNLRRYYPKSFSLCAITIDGRFGGGDTDFSPVERMCADFGIPYYLKRTNLKEVVFDIRMEKNPCSLCARMRRGALHDLCVEQGVNKLALGHHMDDFVETFYMNLFNEGRLASMPPNAYLSRKQIYMIRPLVYCTERETRAAAERNSLCVIKSGCPRDGHSERQSVKEYIEMMDTRYPNFLERSFGALVKSGISGL